MVGRSRRSVFASGFATFATAASAESTSPFYVGFGAGAAFPDDISVTGAGNFIGIPFSLDAETDLDTAFSASTTIGARINNFLAVEGEFAYANFGIAGFEGSFSLGGALFSGRVGVDGQIEEFMGFANAIVSPWSEARFSPYFGGGIGVASVETTIDTITITGLGPQPLNSADTETDFAAQAILGFDYACNDWIDIGARYKFVWVDSGGTTTSGGILGGGSVTVSDMTAHSVMFTGALHF